ncbi:hypothetical protein BGW42_004238 [Actinomortierella wolfii]|nr:hypothetical protein BGW42_004238 [Actinomortierella wolfii]
MGSTNSTMRHDSGRHRMNRRSLSDVYLSRSRDTHHGNARPISLPNHYHPVPSPKESQERVLMSSGSSSRPTSLQQYPIRQKESNNETSSTLNRKNTLQKIGQAIKRPFQNYRAKRNATLACATDGHLSSETLVNSVDPGDGLNVAQQQRSNEYYKMQQRRSITAQPSCTSSPMELPPRAACDNNIAAEPFFVHAPTSPLEAGSTSDHHIEQFFPTTLTSLNEHSHPLGLSRTDQEMEEGDDRPHSQCGHTMAAITDTQDDWCSIWSDGPRYGVRQLTGITLAQAASSRTSFETLSSATSSSSSASSSMERAKEKSARVLMKVRQMVATIVNTPRISIGMRFRLFQQHYDGKRTTEYEEDNEEYSRPLTKAYSMNASPTMMARQPKYDDRKWRKRLARMHRMPQQSHQALKSVEEGDEDEDEDEEEEDVKDEYMDNEGNQKKKQLADRKHQNRVSFHSFLDVREYMPEWQTQSAMTLIDTPDA